MDSYKSKHDALTAFLEKGMTMVHLDARCSDVVVPKHFAGQQDLRLNLSYRFAGAQMEIGDGEIRATLTFGGVPFRVLIPFSSIYALTSHVTGAGLVFPESLPSDIMAALRQEMEIAEFAEPARSAAVGQHAEAPVEAASRPTKAPHLRLIVGDKK